MSLQKEKNVQGVALYLEFRKPYQTIQVIVTPDGLDENGNIVPARFFRRLLSSAEPKKRWKSYKFYSNLEINQALMGETKVEQERMLAITGTRVDSIYDFMKSLVRGGYKLVLDKPIYIEMSKEDFTSVRKGETPVKVINRIKATRNALGFPEPVVTIPAA